jgi:RNA polymerase sigma-70 factor (ECF subfamily)
MKIMVNKENLNELINGCLQNNRKFQEQLFKLYYGKMLVVSMQYTKDRDTAQEIVQDSFIKIFEKLNLFDNKGSLEGWIRRIVVNTAIDRIRKSKKDPFLIDNDNDYMLGGTNPMEELEDLSLSEEKSEIILEAIQQLSPAYRTVFNLYVIEDFTHKEIAEKLGISEGTSKSNLSKARVNIHKLIEDKIVRLHNY